MEQKRIITPFILAGLFAAFGLVCLIIWIKRGKSGKWISHKMKLGAAIITISGISTGCPPQITCYDPAPQNWFSFDSIDPNNYSVVANLPGDSVLTGKVYEPTFTHYTFKVETLDSQFVDQGIVVPFDGQFDQSTENFKLTLNPAINAGNYRLAIFRSERENVENNNEVYQVGLTIK